MLGVLDHNAVLNDLDKGSDKELYIAKYIDDMTLIDAIPTETPFTSDNTGNRILQTLRPERSETAFNNICLLYTSPSPRD